MFGLWQVCAPWCSAGSGSVCCAALSAVPYFLLSLFVVIRLAWDLRLGDTASYWVTSIVLAWEENSLTVALPSQGHVGKGYKRCGGAWTCLESDAPV